MGVPPPPRLPLPFYIRLLTEKAHLSYTYYFKLLKDLLKNKTLKWSKKEPESHKLPAPTNGRGKLEQSLLPGRNKQPILGKHMLPSAGTCLCVPHRSVTFDFNVRLWNLEMPLLDKYLPCVRANHYCSRCDRTFSDKDSLIQHLQHNSKHSVRDVPESCRRCGRSFSGTRALIQHLKNNRHHLKDLHQAACTGRFQLVDTLMRCENADRPGDSHLRSSKSVSKSQMGFTPMHCAAFGGHYECLKIMLSWSDGKPNVPDPKDGRTPVHLAAWKGHANCLKLLLMNGGDLHRPDQHGDTPFSLASDYNCLSIILFHLAGKWKYVC